MKVSEKLKSSSREADFEIPLERIMQCYFASSDHALQLYDKRITHRPDAAFFETRPATNEEALHRSHLVGFLRHLKLCSDLSRQFNRIGFEPDKFHYNIPNTPDFCALHEEAKQVGCKWINRLNTDPKFMRKALYDFHPPRQAECEAQEVDGAGLYQRMAFE